MKRRGLAALFANYLHRWVDGRTAKIIAVSSAVGDRMLLRGTPAEKYRIVLNGIESPLSEGDGATVRAAIGVPIGAPLVVTAARLEAEKGVDVLVKAFKEVLRRLPGAHCVVAGEGSELPQLELMIKRLGIAASVRLLGFRSDVLALIAACDLFVLPSPAEPFGLAIVEAMALGKAVVGCDAGGPAEIVVPWKTGLLVPAGESEQMGEAIVALLSDSAQRNTMGALGRERFQSNFTAERMARETAEVYAKALAGAS
jgi:glycogen(starch) synthase